MVNHERPTTLSSIGPYLANQRHVKLQSPRHLLVKMNFHHNIFTESSQLKCRLLVMAILSRIQSSMTHINFFIIIVVKEEQLVSQPVSISSLKYEKISVMGNCTQKCFVAAEGVLDMAIGEHISDWKSLL